MIHHEQIHRDGYALLRGAIPAEWLEDLRAAFDTGVTRPTAWPVPRGVGWRHSLLDLDPKVQAVCRSLDQEMGSRPVSPGPPQLDMPMAGGAPP